MTIFLGVNAQLSTENYANRVQCAHQCHYLTKVNLQWWWLVEYCITTRNEQMVLPEPELYEDELTLVLFTGVCEPLTTAETVTASRKGGWRICKEHNTHNTPTSMLPCQIVVKEQRALRITVFQDGRICIRCILLIFCHVKHSCSCFLRFWRVLHTHTVSCFTHRHTNTVCSWMLTFTAWTSTVSLLCHHKFSQTKLSLTHAYTGPHTLLHTLSWPRLSLFLLLSLAPFSLCLLASLSSCFSFSLLCSPRLYHTPILCLYHPLCTRLYFSLTICCQVSIQPLA